LLSSVIYTTQRVGGAQIISISSLLGKKVGHKEYKIV